MRERVLAIIGAVAPIAVALLVRSWLGDDRDGSPTGSGGGGGSGGRPVVACTPDLTVVCDALADDGRIADDPPTLDLDSGADAPDPTIDAWITWDPAAWLVNENASQGIAVWAEGAPLGSASLGLLLPSEDREGQDPECGWNCLTEQIVEDGRVVPVGEPTTAVGLARWRPVARSLAAMVDDRHRDIPESQVRGLLDGPTQGQSMASLDRFVTAPGTADWFVGLVPLVEAYEGRRGLTTIIPSPDAEATMVVVSRSGDDSADLADHLDSQALDEALEQVGVTSGGTLVTEDEALGLWHIWDKAR